MDAVNLLHGEKTILIVAHRLTTLKNCDRIYKLEKGKLVESDNKKK
jgi:ABC-type multidrug transport system fused ATPase/permease subunit